ncbi:MAG: hypothetical protein KDC69_05540 [Flavobacteriaceae bacterium]|nr:hypothetical protein [Flavobacteriaceae bacterium]
MKTKISLILAIFFAITFNSVYAQGCDVEEPGATGNGTPNIKVFGFMQPQFDYNLTDGDQANTFKFKRARIGVTGKLANKFSYYFMLETSPFISGGDAYLMDAFITYEASNWARISIGSYKQPFSLEVATPCHGLTTIERSIVADQLVAPQRDYGLAIFGGNKYNKLNYAFAIMNGRGLRVADDNTKKDFIGRVTYKLFDFLTIGGSFRYGYPIPNNNEDSRTTAGGEFLLSLSKFGLQGEYIYDEGAFFAGAGGGCGAEPVNLGEKRDGAYLMATYKVTEKFQPVFKYEYFDANLDVKNSIDWVYQERMTIGFNYFFNDKVRFQLNYLANIDTVINENNDQILAQMQVRF